LDGGIDAAHPRTGFTAFHYACFGNQSDCAEALVHAGCDVGLKDGEGMTGGEVAELQGHAAVVARLRAVVAEQLRAAGRGPDSVAIVDDRRPADCLLMAAQEGDAAAVARLLAAGADPNASVAGRTPSGEVVQTTPLFVAAADGQVRTTPSWPSSWANSSLF
jgi:ankyrin repeat protein